MTPGIRISSAKSDESIGVTGLGVPRQSLENDLVVSLNLKKIMGTFLNITGRVEVNPMSLSLRINTDLVKTIRCNEWLCNNPNCQIHIIVYGQLITNL